MEKTELAAASDPERLRSEWLDRLRQLLDAIQGWAREMGWSTRLIDKRLEDADFGTYVAPALMLQDDTIRILVEPIARSGPGAEGIVDMYLMPAYDDIASIYHYDGGWHLHYMFADSPTVASIRDAKAVPLSKEMLGNVLNEMKQNAV